MSRSAISRVSLILALFFSSVPANAQDTRAIFADAFGSEDPGDGSGTLQNGDFLIKGSGSIGDGHDEDTFWEFDDWRWSDDSTTFTDRFDNIAVLQSAVLTLGLSTKGGLVVTDWVEIDDDRFGNLEEVQNLPANQTIEFQLDLLGFPDEGYSSVALLDFLEEQNGLMPWVYSDDAIVFYAKLELTFGTLCDDAEWTNTGGGSFADAANWSTPEAPQPDTVAIFNSGPSYTVTFPTDAQTDRLVVSDDAIVTLALDLSTYRLKNLCSRSNSLQVTGDATEVTVNNGIVETSRGVVVRDGINPILRVDHGFLYVGDQALRNGTGDPNIADLVVGSSSGVADVEVLAGGLVDVLDEAIFAERKGDSGSLYVSGEGAFFRAADLTIGEDGEGFMDVTNKGAVEVGSVILADENDATANARIDGSVSNLFVTDSVTIAKQGTAELTVTNNGSIFAPDLIISDDDGGDGSLEVSSGGSVVADKLVVGEGGKGQLRVLDGGLVGVGTLQVARRGGVNAPVSVLGAGSSLNASELEIGTGGDGNARVLIANGANVTADSIGIGGQIEGILEIQGATASVKNIVYVGVESNGVLFVGPSDSPNLRTGKKSGTGAASTVTTPALALGDQPGVVGTLIIQDLATLTSETVGVGIDGGSGEAFIRRGGLLRFDWIFAPSRGTALIEVSNGGLSGQDISLGSNGPGTLRIVGSQSVVNLDVLSVYSEGTLDLRSGRLRVRRQAANKSNAVASDSTGITTGALFVSAGASLEPDSLEFGPGGILGGTYAWPIPIVNDGTISPGDSSNSVGAFVADSSYVQTVNGVLDIELGGDGAGEYDRLVVNGPAELSGVLRFSRIDGYLPPLNAEYVVIEAESITGEFEVVESGDFRVSVAYTPTTVTLVVTSSVGVAEPEKDEFVPTDYALHANYPNPFSTTTEMSFDVPSPADVNLELFDITGRRIRTIANGTRPAGRHEVVIDGAGLPAGIYFCRLESDGFVDTRRIVLLR